MVRYDVLLLLLLIHHVTCRLAYLFDLRYTLKLNSTDSYEHVHLVAALGGLANRYQPNLYVLYTEQDTIYLDYMKQIQWPENTTYQTLATIESLLLNFNNVYQGVVLYDPNVPATSNVASTAAGVQNLLPICKRDEPGSLYRQLIISGKLSVKLDLTARFKSKAQVYDYAIQTFLKSTGTLRANGLELGYFVDYWWTRSPNIKKGPIIANTISNHDWVIKNRGFFFDLSPWDDVVPVDEPDQPIGEDYRTLNKILRAVYDQHDGKNFSYVNGFVPWLFKYIDDQHQGVPAENRMCDIVTAYNVAVDADACCINGMANAAFFSHYNTVLDNIRFIQNAVPTKQELINQGFIVNDKVVTNTYAMFYGGDYDSSAWVYSVLKNLWDDPKRGQVPIGWAVNPNISRRFPIIFPYLYKTRSNKDYFISGDSGPGYVNPNQLFAPRRHSHLPSGDAVWEKLTNYYYQKFNLKFTGFLINGEAGASTNEVEQLYAKFSPLGIVNQIAHNGTHIIPGTHVPAFTEHDIDTTPVQDIINQYKPGVMQFKVFRAVIKQASYYANTVEEVNQKVPIKFVDPYTFGLLARIHLSGDPNANNDLITYFADTLPKRTNDKTINANITIRNEGWNILENTTLMIFFNDVICSNTTVPNVRPGTLVTVGVTITVPVTPGIYQVKYELYRNATPFSVYGNLAWRTEIIVG
jgi:hypothetical protein